MGAARQAAARPYVYSNFVISRDGRVSFNEPGQMSGADVSGFDEHDRWLMALLRSRADAILMGDNTLRIEPDHLWTAEFIFPPDALAFAALRRWRAGRRPAAGVSLPRRRHRRRPGRGLLAARLPRRRRHDDARRCSAARSPATDARVDVLELGDGGVDVRALLGALRDDYGVETVLCEGGPRAYGSMLAAGCVDDEFLTLSPLVIGAAPECPRPSLVEGVAFPAANPPCSRPLSLHRAGDMLFLRTTYT